MKRYSFYCMAVILLLISCKNKKIPSVLTAANLPGTFITLDADSSYTLKTPKGAIIKIDRNSFDVPQDTKVQVEIKEAYSANDILLAGLSTTSDGKLLQSGGMIYFNATANGENVTITNPIHISIPTKNYDTSMQLFKGDIQKDSTINWVNPQPLDSSSVAKELNIGKALFQQNCKSCHKPNEDFTGPALMFCRRREPNANWAYSFIDHTNTMLLNDPYAKALYSKFGSPMQQQNLAKYEIKAILDYCDNAAPSASAGFDTPIATKIDSITEAPCGYDTIYTPLPDTSIQELPEDTTTSINTVTNYSTPAPSVSLYDFKISTCGWYNIDCFIDANANAVSNVQLTATINNIPEGVNMEVYICIPSRKLLSNERGQKGNNYTFYDSDDDSIQLILNDDALIVAIGGNNDKLYYGVTKFNVKTQQVITVNVKETTKKAINKSIHDNKLDKIKIDPEEPVTVPVTPDTVSVTDENIIDSATTKQEMQMQVIPTDCNGQH
jgi:cytochrome c